MNAYRLSKAARADLKGIAEFGDENFGLAQSDRYRDLLKERFDLIAEQLLLFPSVDHISVGYRRSVCGAHSIYYKAVEDGVEIMRILGRQVFQE